MRNPRSSVRDMLLSLAVILVPAALIYYFFASSPDEPPVTTIDWAPVVADARAEASYPILAPRELPDGWRVNRAKWVPNGGAVTADQVAEGNTWIFGALSPDDIYHEIRQRDANIPGLVRAQSRTGYPDGSSTVAGRNWVRMTSASGATHCLVDQADSVGTTVCADTGFAELESFVGQLTAS